MSEQESTISRTLRSAVDLTTMDVISWKNLLSADERQYNEIRREATRSKQSGSARYVCSQCGYPVYAPLERNGRPHWKHFSGAPSDCPWSTSDPKSPDRVSAGQFQGQQEGPLHYKIKYQIAELLEKDNDASDVAVEQYVLSNEGRRKPDVSAVYNGFRIAFEIQLATTQLPIILAKERFYADRGIRIVWVTWDFQHRPLADIRQSFLDIYFSHDENLFSLDADTIAESLNRSKLILRAHAYRSDEWQSALTSLSEVSWNSNGLPYVYPRVEPWHVEFEASWIACRKRSAYDYRKEECLLLELSDQLNIELSAHDWQNLKIPSLLDILYSLRAGRPLTSNQNNLFAMANSFLGTSGCGKFADIFQYFARRYDQCELLVRDSVAKKLKSLRPIQQVEKGSPVALAVRLLFPGIVSETKKT